MNAAQFFTILSFYAALLAFGIVIKRSTWSLSRKVFIALLLGTGLGFVYQLTLGVDNPDLKASIGWFNIVGNGYVTLLQMVVMPLVFVSILSAISKLHNASSLGKISGLTIGTLLFTTAISAFIGILMSKLFGLTAAGLVEGAREADRLASIQEKYIGQVEQLDIPKMLLSFIPKNPFLELTGANSTSIISVVIFAVFLGLAAIRLYKDDAPKGEKLLAGIDILQTWIMKLVRIVMLLTPFGVFALITRVVATANQADILQLASFMVASYLGLGLILVVHAVILFAVGVSPVAYFKKSLPVLAFAFTSRSSAAAIPMNIETQTKRLGVPQAIASFAASFGATIGQNGCAGLYPAMLAVMVAPTVGINPFEPLWMLTLVGIVTLSSAGVAGVGGGATFAALIVLPALGLPVTIVALLVSIEPLIDMGRTAVNVSGAMTAGTVTSQLLKQTDKKVLENQHDEELAIG